MEFLIMEEEKIPKYFLDAVSLIEQSFNGAFPVLVLSDKVIRTAPTSIKPYGESILPLKICETNFNLSSGLAMDMCSPLGVLIANEIMASAVMESYPDEIDKE
jgi:hypothetical protein